MKKIKAIFFDLGGVVLTQRPEARLETIAEVFEISVKDLESVFKKYNNDWSTGKITVKTLAKKLKGEFKHKKTLSNILKTWKEVYINKTVPNIDLINLIDVLKRKYQVYLLTNTVDLHHGVNSKRNIFSHFDGIFASFLMGKKKPEQNFYTHVLEELELNPNECVFIDDRKENIDAAKKIGIESILFKNNQKLLIDLRKLGVKV